MPKPCSYKIAMLSIAACAYSTIAAAYFVANTRMFGKFLTALLWTADSLGGLASRVRDSQLGRHALDSGYALQKISENTRGLLWLV